MKHTRLLLLATALALSLTACGGSQSNTPSEPDTSEPEVLEAEAPAAEAPPSTPEEAYRKILLDIYEKGVLPDIYEKGISPDGLKLCAPEEDPHEKAANNDFSIYDVDNDGNVELLLLWADDCVAGRIGIVYGYQDGEVYSELMEYPAMTFYENGIVTADISHNQGRSGRFWPQELYRYDSDSDTYQYIGALSGWDQTIPPGVESFPTDIDADGDGMVYFHPDLPENPDGSYTPVDGPAFEAWWSTLLDGAQPLELPLQKLTEENIAALGYPEPQTVILPSED